MGWGYRAGYRSSARIRAAGQDEAAQSQAMRTHAAALAIARAQWLRRRAQRRGEKGKQARRCVLRRGAFSAELPPQLHLPLFIVPVHGIGALQSQNGLSALPGVEPVGTIEQITVKEPRNALRE